MQRETVSRLVFTAFLVYVLALLGLQTGHLFWLLKVHTELRRAYGLDAQTPRHSWGFIGAILLLLLMVVGPFFVTSVVRKYGDVRISWLGGRSWVMVFWPISLCIYNGQVILFIVSTVNLYLDLSWSRVVATCACHTDPDPLLNGTGSALAHCQCLVPIEDCAYQLSTLHLDDISDVDLRRRGSSYHGNVTVNPMATIADVDQWLDDNDFNRNFQYVLVLTKASALVTVLHFPLWLLDHYLIELASAIRSGPSLETGTTRQNILRIITDLVAHMVYCFSENIDGYSLLEEYMELSGFFWGNGYLRDAILAFVGSNIILVAGYNGVSRLLKQYEVVTLIVRCLIVVLNNLPFMLLRIYMLWKVGGGRILSAGISTNFFFFVAKEAIFLIVYFIECGFSIHEYRTRRRGREGEGEEGGGGGQAAWTGLADDGADSRGGADVHVRRRPRRQHSLLDEEEVPPTDDRVADQYRQPDDTPDVAAAADDSEPGRPHRKRRKKRRPAESGGNIPTTEVHYKAPVVKPDREVIDLREREETV